MGTHGYPTRLTLDRNGPQGGTKLPEPPNEITVDLRIRSTLFARTETQTPRITVDPQRSQWTSPQTDHSGPIWGNGEGEGKTAIRYYRVSAKSTTDHKLHPTRSGIHLWWDKFSSDVYRVLICICMSVHTLLRVGADVSPPLPCPPFTCVCSTERHRGSTEGMKDCLHDCRRRSADRPQDPSPHTFVGLLPIVGATFEMITARRLSRFV